MHQHFHIRFVRPNGWSYELWPQVDNEAQAVKAADELLEYLERVGITDYLEPDGVSVRGGASLQITAITAARDVTPHLRITKPDGTIVEK